MKTRALLGLAATAAATAHGPHHAHEPRQAPASTPNINTITRGIKAGLSGFQGVGTKPGFAQLAPHISWYSDYQPDTPDVGAVVGTPMLWGDDTACGSIGGDRLKAFNTSVAEKAPKIMFGFYEPDCNCSSSAEMTVADGVQSWKDLIAPLKKQGTILGSPSACKQKDEKWLIDMTTPPLDTPWDITSIHVNKNSLEGVIADVDHYVRQYNKPVWVSEFACVNDQDWTFCDQATANQFMKDAVNFFHCNESVVAYGPSNGEGLGTVWPLFTEAGGLSATGNAYLNALQSFTSPPNACPAAS